MIDSNEDSSVSEQQNEELRNVVDRIEAKLERLEDEREQIKHKVELKRAQVQEMENALDSLRDLETNLKNVD
jgi:predicted RNase H-like nuclease (RuvC/YqgF family)